MVTPKSGTNVLNFLFAPLLLGVFALSIFRIIPA
jgi:hypothetical protein